MKKHVWVLLMMICVSGLFYRPAMADSFSYNDHGQRDPFWPLVSSGGAIINYDSNFSASELILEGIIADGQSRIAIINGNIVEEGKKIGFYTVRQILGDHVVLEKDGQSIELRMKKEE